MGRYSSPDDTDLLTMINKMRQDLNTLMRTTKMPATSIDEGDFTVRGGGSVILKDGGDFLIEEGHLRVKNPDGSDGIFFGEVGSYVLVGGVETFIPYGIGMIQASSIATGGAVYYAVYQMYPPNEDSIYFFVGQSIQPVKEAKFVTGNFSVEATPVAFPNSSTVFIQQTGASGGITLNAEARIFLTSTAEYIKLDAAKYIHLNAIEQLTLSSDAGVLIQRGAGFVWIEHTTTAAAANCVINTNGAMQRSTSSRKYKQSIEDASIDVDAFLEMRWVRFKDRLEVEEYGEDNVAWYHGYIAEEVAELGLKEFVVYDSEGPDALTYDRMIGAAQQALKDHRGRIVQLEKVVREQGEEIAELRQMIRQLMGGE